jgi:hypothetical protein
MRIFFCSATFIVVDPDPGCCAFLTSGSGMEKNPEKEYIPGHISKSLATIFLSKDT